MGNSLARTSLSIDPMPVGYSALPASLGPLKPPCQMGAFAGEFAGARDFELIIRDRHACVKMEEAYWRMYAEYHLHIMRRVPWSAELLPHAQYQRKDFDTLT